MEEVGEVLLVAGSGPQAVNNKAATSINMGE
jgi:hypothetical protein